MIYLYAAYAAVLALIVAYLLYLHLRVRALERRLEEQGRGQDGI